MCYSVQKRVENTPQKTPSHQQICLSLTKELIKNCF
jgi:hypothetical protein